jgi:hypothetical protein
MMGKQNCNFSSWGVTVDIGNLHFGQRRDFVIKVTVPQNAASSGQPFVSATLKYEALPINSSSSAAMPGGAQEVQLLCDSLDQSPEQCLEGEVQTFRCRLIDLIADKMEEMSVEGSVAQAPSASDLCSDMTNWVRAARQLRGSGDAVKRVEALRSDLTGQISEAVSKPQYFNKWGKHYLPSLLRAHSLQQCNNFKDPGIQFYGGSLFNSVRDVADDVFCSMPPPVATPPTRGMGSSSSSYSSPSYSHTPPAAPAVNMRSYYNASAPCFPAFCKVTMGDGSVKLVGEVRKGDIVLCPDVLGNSAEGDITARVECIVKTMTRNGKMSLVTLSGGLVVTPWHPVQVEGQWRFPIDVCVDAGAVACDAVYSFVLEKFSCPGASESRGAAMLINGTKCITLAHSLPIDDKVASHEFYGTEAVVRALKNVSYGGYRDGLVALEEGCVEKDVVTGRACGFKVLTVDAINDEREMVNEEAMGRTTIIPV